MRFALVDLHFGDRKANRDHTGGFGSMMSAEGLWGGLVSRVKMRLIDLPLTSFGFTAAILRRAGHTVRFEHGPTEGADVILIASSMHCHAEEVAFARQERRRHPEARIGFFGPFVQTNPHVFADAADFLIFGEMESAVLAFVDGGLDFSGRLDRGIVTDLARLPVADWDGLDLSPLGYFPLLHRRPFLTVQASRGCSFNCDFCPYMVSQTEKHRVRPVETVLDEIENDIERYGVRSILFRDIVFGLDRAHARAIAEGIMRRGLRLEWACESRVDCLKDELIDLMVASGLRGVNLGIESNDVRKLRDNGRPPPAPGRQQHTIAHLQRRGVRINGFYILGLLGDTPRSMADTIRYAGDLNTLGAQFCTLTPFPGTKFFERTRDSLLTSDFTQFTEYRPVVAIKSSTPQQIEQASARAYRGYYLRPRWLLRYGLPTAARLAQCLVPVRGAPAPHDDQQAQEQQQQLRETQAFWDANPCDGQIDVGARQRFRYAKESWLPGLLERIAAAVGRGTLLEIGCGQGTDALYLCRHLDGDARYCGIDCSANSVRMARAGSAGHEGLRVQPDYRTGNAEALYLPDASVNGVYALGVLHHTPDTSAAIAEIHRVLKPGCAAWVVLYRTASPKLLAAHVVRRAARAVDRLVGGRLVRSVRALGTNHRLGTMLIECVGVPVLRSYRRARVERLFAAFESVSIEPVGVGLPMVNRLVEPASPVFGSYWLVEARKSVWPVADGHPHPQPALAA